MDYELIDQTAFDDSCLRLLDDAKGLESLNGTSPCSACSLSLLQRDRHSPFDVMSSPKRRTDTDVMKL